VTGGSLQVSLGVRMTGKDRAPGNTPTSTIPDSEKTVAGGGSQVLAYGSGSNRADTFAASEFAIPPLTALTLDLYAGGVGDEDLQTVLGQSAPFRILRSLVVVLAAGTGDESGVRCGGAPSDEFQAWFVRAGDKFDIFPGGPPFVQGSPAGKSVTATARNFRIENLSESVFARVRVYAAGGKIVSGMSMGTVGGVYP
jgi:hypothetical protein